MNETTFTIGFFAAVFFAATQLLPGGSHVVPAIIRFATQVLGG